MGSRQVQSLKAIWKGHTPNAGGQSKITRSGHYRAGGRELRKSFIQPLEVCPHEPDALIQSLWCHKHATSISGQLVLETLEMALDLRGDVMSRLATGESAQPMNDRVARLDHRVDLIPI